ncbi:MAG: hypothetical protein N4A53_08115 [Pelagimonas sp.]|jgi:hypothetical protein|nr:hypothetical protein [Pelagimonas sp.]
MAALTMKRNTPRAQGDMKVGVVAAANRIFAGAIVMRNAAGYLVKGQTALNLIGVGVAHEEVDNATGADGDESLKFRAGTWRFANSAGADEITIAAIGTKAFAVDDQTVALSDGGGTRSPAGLIEDVDELGVWIRFDQALTAAS